MLKKYLIVNGVKRTIIADPETSLADVLRKQTFLTGTKVGCRKGECGACSVILDGKVVRSCITKIKRVRDEAEITTIEGVGDHNHLHPLQLAWMIHGAAQCGYCTPGFIVSAKVLLEHNSNPTREDVRAWFQKNRNVCRCTGYVPLVDAVMEAARLMRGEVTKEELWYKLPKGESLLGSDAIRPSALAKVTGTWDFGADLGLKLPEDTLHIKLVQATVSHANILSIDTSEAEKMPGVFKVITYKDVPGTNRINGLAFPTNKGDGLERPILCDKKVFQFGDAIAMVLADTPCQAEAAAAKVKVEIEELPAYMSAPAAMAEDAMEIHPGTPNIYFECGTVKGEDTAPLMKSLEYVVEDDSYVGRQPHLPLEPDVGFAYINENGKLIVHSKSIGLHIHAAMVADGIGVPLDDLKIVQNPTGGTFGYKFSPTMEGLLGVAALLTKRTVYLEFNMYQQITYTGKRSPFFMHLKLGADKNGKFTALETDWSCDHGPYCEFGDLVTTRGSQFMGAGYNIPNIRGEGRTVATNHAWGSAFRGYGSPQSLFASEVLVDKLAKKMGVDPLELRYKNAYREGDKTPTGCDPDVIVLPDLIEKIMPRYKVAKEKAAEKNAKGGNMKYGVGTSLLIYGCGLDGPDTSNAWAELTKEGVTIGNSWQDHGQGADMGTLTIAHETLRPIGIAPEQIKLLMNDMEFTPDSGPSGGSRSNVLTGNATRVACENLLAAMKKTDGTYMTYDEMVAAGKELKYDGKWTAPCTAPDPATGQGNPFPTYMYGVLLSEVEVDTTTGKVKVEKLTLAADVGTIVNKLVVDGQMYGGLAQGIGLALSEDFEDLKKHTTLTGCGIPQVKDVPDDIEIIYKETPRPLGPYGASGSGEMPLSAPHASIVNAIYDATGAQITKLPARPEKVLAALEALKK
ncbi:aldehyde oxidoreductase [Clostridium carboxidivorans P7]|uniref:Aldehyde oxidase and xanthine dehydrogenase molybdopterin binding n=1 Tax=Clostridium carboxidivorans P7 TaxID=536227 RepID=C6PY29_9CLOT|nr:molybdopterin-dependent aldehyde oxidoreductase [Clostridium carboxidivorans]AKN33871.1 aldehyde oxidoreductase [Clostridium carboxidivorans P7]EET85864.1 aldehyde oxidase and xanthine dehydrogenase molybdopterin binding [Clostridium carboxidivorans P7]EFG86514.1 aldehyde oxidase and xanthine dehydrogenase, molybdopterin binding domain protein [Clostridium carboxidivorans P7]